MWVEQENGAVVPGNICYRRYTLPEAVYLLEAIDADLHLSVNFFQPVRKLIEKKRNGARACKRDDVAQTPYQRALLAPDVDAHCKVRLRRE